MNIAFFLLVLNWNCLITINYYRLTRFELNIHYSIFNLILTKISQTRY